jgi:hypothetical protein
MQSIKYCRINDKSNFYSLLKLTRKFPPPSPGIASGEEACGPVRACMAVWLFNCLT